MSEKILIADDEPSNRKILAQELVHKGFAVDTARGGKEALAKIESAPPSLVILDYMMPDLSGLEVLKELRNRGNDTPVILITAYGSVERAVEVMKAGAYDFITRPFDPDYIELVVRKAIERQTLKREVEVLSEENRDRYHLIIGESPKMKLAVDMARKRRRAARPYCFSGKAAPGRNYSRDSFTIKAIELIDLSSRSTPSAFRRNCWKATCSDTNREHLPARTS